MTAHSAAARHWPRRRQRGFSLFGVLLGLGLAAVAIVGATQLFNSARETQERGQAVQLLAQLRTGMETAFAGRPSYGAVGDDLVPFLIARGLMPDSATSSATTARHPFGGDVDVTAQTLVNGVTTQFAIVFAALPAETCAWFGDQFVGATAARTGLVSINLGGGARTPPVAAATVATDCSAGGTPKNVTWLFE